MNRSFSHLLLSLLFLFPYFSSLAAQGPAANGKQQLPRYMVNPDALNTPQFKAMVEEAEGFLNNLSEDEMKEFMSFYEEFLKGVESGEIDLNEYLPEGILQPLSPEEAQALLAQEAAPEAPAPTPAPKPVPVAPTAIEDVNDAIAMINAIIEHIESIFTKAESDPTISASINPWKERLSKLIVYLKLLSQKKHVQRLLSDAEHKGVLDILKDLRQQLSIYEPQITVPEFGLGVLQKQEKEVSKRALQKAIEAVDNAITNKELMQQIEKIFAKYEPEALKKAQDMLAAQERAKRPVAAVPSTHMTPVSLEVKPEARYGRGRGYEPEFPEYGGGRGRLREEPSFWGAEPETMAKPGGKEGAAGGKPTTIGGAKGAKKPEEIAAEEKEAKEKEKGKKPEKEKGKKAPVPPSNEAKKMVDDIEKRVDMIVDELLPEKDKLKSFVDQLLDPTPTPATEKLTAITDELGRISRKSGQFKGLPKQSVGDAATTHTNAMKKLSTKLVPLYTEVRGIALPAKLDTPHLQAIDAFIKTCDMIFPNFRAITPTNTYKIKKPAVAPQPRKAAKEAAMEGEEEITEPEEAELEEEGEEVAPELPARPTPVMPGAIPAKATIVTPQAPLTAERYTITPGRVEFGGPHTAEYVEEMAPATPVMVEPVMPESTVAPAITPRAPSAFPGLPGAFPTTAAPVTEEGEPGLD